jgi:hypothetical protein
MVITIEAQFKDLILRSLTFVWDAIEFAGRFEKCRTTWVTNHGVNRKSAGYQ